MQLLQSSTTKRFMYNYWALRNKLIKDIGSKLHKKYGIDIADMFLLQHVLDHDFSPTELAEHLQIPPHGISRMLENLQGLGLLERTLHPRDARRRVLTVTSKGKETLENSLAMMDGELQTMLSVLDKASLQKFIDNLEKLAKVDSS